MTYYKIKPEYIHKWCIDADHEIVNDEIIQTMSREWEVPVETLMEQVEETEEPAPFLLIWDNDSCRDGIPCGDLQNAFCQAEDIYESWVTWQFNHRITKDSNLNPIPTTDEVEEWDWMIESCYCYVVEWNAESCEYSSEPDAYFLPDEKLESIGWMFWAFFEEKFFPY